MPAKKATKTVNICANIYEGEFSVTFDCVGAFECRFLQCDVMPPEENSECVWNEHGTCLSPHSKGAALELIVKKLKSELKQIDENLEV
jgi:hypothetical protein